MEKAGAKVKFKIPDLAGPIIKPKEKPLLVSPSGAILKSITKKDLG